MQDSSWLVLSALSRKNPIFSSQPALDLETVEVVEILPEIGQIGSLTLAQPEQDGRVAKICSTKF